MNKILIASTIVIVLLTGTAFGGQCTGGDKRGLNPQPLPPGRHHQYRRTHHQHKHRHKTAYSPQWGGFLHNQTANSNNKPK